RGRRRSWRAPASRGRTTSRSPLSSACSVPDVVGKVEDVATGPGERRERHVEALPCADMREQGPVHPIHDGTVVLPRPAEAGAVLVGGGDEDVVALQTSERVEHRQGLGEAGGGAVGGV